MKAVHGYQRGYDRLEALSGGPMRPSATLHGVSSTIQAVLWDFGGVILSSPFEAFARYETDNGLPADLIRTINKTNPDDNAWAKFERSDVSVAGFCALFEAEAAALGHTVDAQQILACLRGEVRPRMVEAIARLRGTYALAMLTNNIAPMDADQMSGHVGPDTAPILELFDEIIESSKVGVRKPEPRFYEIACERLGVEPAQCVFLDDLGINLKPARAMGMTTIKVVDPDVALTELETVLGVELR